MNKLGLIEAKGTARSIKLFSLNVLLGIGHRKEFIKKGRL